MDSMQKSENARGEYRELNETETTNEQLDRLQCFNLTDCLF